MLFALVIPFWNSQEKQKVHSPKNPAIFRHVEVRPADPSCPSPRFFFPLSQAAVRPQPAEVRARSEAQDWELTKRLELGGNFGMNNSFNGNYLRFDIFSQPKRASLFQSSPSGR